MLKNGQSMDLKFLLVTSQISNFWKKFKKKVGKIDIILDDGGHRYIDQITSIECILSNIKHNGLIVVEDTHTSYMDGFGDKKIFFYKLC